MTLQIYFAARSTGGIFGAGTGPEYQPDLDPTMGTYQPTWLDLEVATAATVYPRELIALLCERGVGALLREPVHLEEVGPGR